MKTISCQTAWREMCEASQSQSVRNYTRCLDMRNFVVETELFPLSVLEAYSSWNLEKPASDIDRSQMTEARGGAQGDYREGMAKKISNVVDCLSRFPQSKRAVITISNDAFASHQEDASAKCLRELHLYFDDNHALSATVYFRAQAATIFPKNIHFIGSVMTEVAKQLPTHPILGTVFYHATILVSERHY